MENTLDEKKKETRYPHLKIVGRYDTGGNSTKRDEGYLFIVNPSRNIYDIAVNSDMYLYTVEGISMSAEPEDSAILQTESSVHFRRANRLMITNKPVIMTYDKFDDFTDIAFSSGRISYVGKLTIKEYIEQYNPRIEEVMKAFNYGFKDKEDGEKVNDGG